MSEETKIVDKNKISKKMPILTVAGIVIVLVVFLLMVLSKSAEAKKLEEQLDLGDKYLCELQYEQAVVAYLAAIEIDPKNVDAYLGLADAYVAMGEYDKAIEVLENALDELSGEAAEIIKDKLEEIRKAKEVAEVTSAVESTVASTPTPTVALTATSTPTPTSTPTLGPTATSTPIPTPTPTPTPTNTPVPTAAPTPTPMVLPNSVIDVEGYRIGNIVNYGWYEQDNVLENGKEAIQWIVLDIQDNKALLFSLYGLDVREFNHYHKFEPWEKCDLRAWLNEEFMESAYNENDEKNIVNTLLLNADNPNTGTECGNDTWDKVFCLSLDEVNKYLFDEEGNPKSFLKAQPTAYAETNGEIYYDYMDEYCDYWLRTMGDSILSAMVVTSSGEVYEEGLLTENSGVTFRPAMWLDISDKE